MENSLPSCIISGMRGFGKFSWEGEGSPRKKYWPFFGNLPIQSESKIFEQGTERGILTPRPYRAAHM